MRLTTSARHRPDGRHYSGQARFHAKPVLKRAAAGVLGLALLAGTGMGTVASASAEPAPSPSATAQAGAADATPSPAAGPAPALQAPAAALAAAQSLSCASGIVYTVGSDKKIRRVSTSDGAQVEVGSFPSAAAVNGLALTKNAEFAYAVRSTPVPAEWVWEGWSMVQKPSYMTVYRYDSVSGNTNEYKVQQGISTDGTFVMGGINPATGYFYYGRVLNSALELYAFNTQTNSDVGLVGSIKVDNDKNGSARSNGDLVFSADGTMYFVASSGGSASNANALMQVTQQLPTTHSSAPLTATLVTDLDVKSQAFNGIAFEGGYLYLDTTAGRLYKVNPSNGAIVGNGPVSTGLSSPVDMASCQYNNSLIVKKNIAARVAAGDQFILNATADSAKIGTAGTTSGTDSGLQTASGTFASSVPISGTTIVVSETATAGANLANYTSTWLCTDQAGGTVAKGTGTSGTFVFPKQSASGVNVSCVFTNTPLSAKVTVTKTWVGAVAGDTASFTANTVAGTSTAPANGNVISTSFAQGTRVTVAELLGAANKGSYTTALECTDSSGTVAQGTLSGSFVLGAGDVTCAFTNTNSGAAVTVHKKWIVDGVQYDHGKQPQGINAALTLTGPATAGASGQAWSTERAGYFTGSTVTIGETTTIDPSMACKLTGSKVTLANGTTAASPVPFTAVLAAGANSYTVTNTVDCTTQLTLLKFIDKSNGGSLVPGDFTLTAQPGSGAALVVPGANTVAAANTKAVAAGASYTLSESGGSKTAYLQLGLQRYTGALKPDGSLADPNAWEDAASTTVTVATGRHAIYRFVNASAPAMALPLTGGTGSSPYMIAGGGLLLLAALTAAGVAGKRIRSKRR